MTTNYTCTT